MKFKKQNIDFGRYFMYNNIMNEDNWRWESITTIC